MEDKCETDVEIISSPMPAPSSAPPAPPTSVYGVYAGHGSQFLDRAGMS